MTTSFEGRLTLGDVLPLPLLAQTTLDLTLGNSIADIQPRIDGLASIIARPPAAITDLISAAEAALEALQALAAAPLPDVAATASILADLTAQIGGLRVQLALNANFGELLSAGVYYYLFAGKASQVGPELGALLSLGLSGVPFDQELAGVFLLASDGGAVSALQSIFKS